MWMTFHIIMNHPSLNRKFAGANPFALRIAKGHSKYVADLI